MADINESDRLRYKLGCCPTGRRASLRVVHENERDDSPFDYREMLSNQARKGLEELRLRQRASAPQGGEMMQRHDTDDMAYLLALMGLAALVFVWAVVGVLS